jgi:hypothetical protein
MLDRPSHHYLVTVYWLKPLLSLQLDTVCALDSVALFVLVFLNRQLLNAVVGTAKKEST